MTRTRKRVLYVVAAFIAANVAFDLYARMPARFEVEPLGMDPAAQTVVLLFHGRYGSEETTLRALEQRMRELAGNEPGTVVDRYVWSPHSDTRFRSNANGVHIGAALGEELARMPRVAVIHLIGHSAGAYLVDPLCEAYRKAGGRARVVATYLDPIGFRGVLDWGWGARHYGACADYSEAFINTDDAVPGTNAPLAHAWNVDVTEAGKASQYAGGGHRWPVQYYLDRVSAADLAAASDDNRDRPRGAVVNAR